MGRCKEDGESVRRMGEDVGRMGRVYRNGVDGERMASA